MSRLSFEQNIARFRVEIHAGRFFEAHEIMEAVWIENGRRRGDVWQGLTQLAVALMHASRGNHAGAARVYAKALKNLEQPAREFPAVAEFLAFAGRVFTGVG